MNRYINADRLKKHFEWWESEAKAKEFKEIFDEIIDAQPTAAVVEVVRCKDCKHLEIINGPHIYARCNLHEFPIISFGVIDTREWFCADGERREDGEIH